MSLSIAQIVIDCENAETLAGFWSQLLERPVDPGAGPFFATIGRPAGGASESTPQGPVAGPALMFLKVPEGKQVKNRLHIDLHPDGQGADGPAEIERAIGLGAKHVGEHREYGMHWVTLQDPEGNEFDLAVGSAAQDG